MLDYTLLYCTEEETDMTDKKFYERKISPNHEHQMCYLEGIQKTYHKFVVVGISKETQELEV